VQIITMNSMVVKVRRCGNKSLPSCYISAPRSRSTSTRKVDDLVKALGADSWISGSEVLRIWPVVFQAVVVPGVAADATAVTTPTRCGRSLADVTGGSVDQYQDGAWHKPLAPGALGQSVAATRRITVRPLRERQA
jgi:hypothetical protein